MRTLQYAKNLLKCNVDVEHLKAELQLLTAVNDTLIVSIKENKTHITYSINKIEERALYELLRSRNE